MLTGMSGMTIINYDHEIYMPVTFFYVYGSYYIEESIAVYKLFPEYGEKGAILTTGFVDDFIYNQNLKSGGELASYQLTTGQTLYTLYAQNINKTDAIDINSTNAGYLTINLTTTTSAISSSVFTAPYIYTYTHDDFSIETLIVHSTTSSDKAGLCIRDNLSATNSLVYIINNGDTTIQSGNAYSDPYGNYLDTSDHSASHKYLKITRSGDTITTYSKAASTDNWTQRDQYTRTDLPKSLQVGIVAYSSSAGGTYVPKFDYLKLNSDVGPSIMDITRTINFTGNLTVNTIGLGSRAVGTGTYDYPAYNMQWGSRVNITPVEVENGDSMVITYRIKVTG
jgi:hypothetical protein